MSQSSSKVVISEAPFHSKEGADLVLRSSDRVLFFVRKYFLTGASPFFLNLLADGTPEERHEGLPICPVSEESLTMRAILQLCHPYHIAPLTFLDTVDVAELVVSLRKYIMEDASKRLEHVVRDGCVSLTSSGQTLLKTSPLRVFALARILGLDDIVPLALHEVLYIPLDELEESPELEYISGRDYHRLVKYYTDCGRAAENVIPGHLVQETCGLSFGIGEPDAQRPHLVWAGVHLHVSRSWATAEYVADIQRMFRNQPMGNNLEAKPLIKLMDGTCGAVYKELQAHAEKALKALKEKIHMSIAKVKIPDFDARQPTMSSSLLRR
ncbi:hypothetical protein CYLTODRAFT_488363 [Cylindrobasidium torrendii FP15055 ss-10]|uniref:BTB domain-containing protein n=1 Tax=Cylindrobasidium torrendii FP15055 ss-10 TaxID=1314674 RepID=A0A0D7BKE6_9AGAR|nr:hypothetical protein CYLTODRAFT_488363 [Cylindrobasidium torrendii FP15055 ss-10]